MQRRPLGRSGLSTPPLMLGGNVFGWTVDAGQSVKLLDAFVAGGGTMIDTADIYSNWIPGNKGGESETVIGEWLQRRGRRDDVLIATKVGHSAGAGGEGLAPARIAAGIEESLERLQTDYVDLYFAHRDDPRQPLEDVLDAFDRLIKAGKVRAIAASNYEAPRLAEALRISAENGLARFEVLQPKYNLVDRAEFENDLQQLCVDEEIGVTPYYGLAAGFLTGKYRSAADIKGARSHTADHYLKSYGLGAVEALDAVAAELSATPAQVAIAWLAAQPAIAAPIASGTTVEQIEQLLAALRLELTPAQLDHLDAASAASEAVA